jgi:hypothetical protein
MSNASHQPCNQMGAEPCSYNGASEVGSDVCSAPLMPNLASKKCWTLGLRNQTPTPWKEDADCGNGYHRERGSDLFSAGGERRKIEKEKKAFSSLKEREKQRDEDENF